MRSISFESVVFIFVYAFLQSSNSVHLLQGYFFVYQGFTGICKSEGSLKPYFIFQAIAVILEVTISIIGAFGFNGFARAHDLFEEGKGFSGALAVIVSSVFLSVALFSSYIFVRILREKKELTVGLV